MVIRLAGAPFGQADFGIREHHLAAEAARSAQSAVVHFAMGSDAASSRLLAAVYGTDAGRRGKDVPGRAGCARCADAVIVHLAVGGTLGARLPVALFGGACFPLIVHVASSPSAFQECLSRPEVYAHSGPSVISS